MRQAIDDFMVEVLMFIYSEHFLTTFFSIVALLYFIPAVLAVIRRAQNRYRIFWVNVLFGWTFLGWLGAFYWAVTGDRRVKP